MFWFDGPVGGPGVIRSILTMATPPPVGYGVIVTQDLNLIGLFFWVNVNGTCPF